jgi:hypothetical protein
MHTETAFHRRATLTRTQLERLRTQLVDEVERYRLAIRGYSPEKMERFGSPYLTELEGRVAEVDRLLTAGGKAR